MINHARTLLMNVTGPRQPDGGAEFDAYIPEYYALRMPEGLQRVRELVFGTDPDYQGLCVRAAQCLRLVAATPYAEWLRSMDARITYAGSWDVLAFPSVTVTSTDGSMLATGGRLAAETDGKCRYAWDVVWADGVYTLRQGGTDIGTGSGSVIALGTSGLTVTSASIPAEPAVWSITATCRPETDVVSALLSVMDSPDCVRALFEGTREQTFMQLADRHGLSVYRAAGVVLGLIDALECVRARG